MKLIVGLGNIGEKHEKNRHNLGFMVVEQFFKNFEPVKKTTWEDNDRFKSFLAEIEWQRRSSHSSSGQAHNLMEKIILCKPKTFMNNSGLATRLLCEFYKIPPEDMWVIHDDIDLPLGSIRIRNGGSAAGHRGIESLLKELGTEKFWRFRLGIGHPKKIVNSKDKIAKISMRGVDEFVLGDFNGSEHAKVKDMIKRSAKAIAHALEVDLSSAMNKFNTK